MSGNAILLDTNIVLAILGGNKTLDEFISGNIIYISFITELELFGFKNLSPQEEKAINSFVADCRVLDINPVIKQHTIKIRKVNRLKLPDSIVAATALYLETPLLTADADFKAVKNLELIFYK
jgi:predicted nucleic acid-binding protein